MSTQIKPLKSGYDDTPDLKFRHVGLSEDRAFILCHLTNGGGYDLPVKALAAAEDWDSSGIKEFKLIDWNYAAEVKLKSGACIDFAVDFVLHHCEPNYSYHFSRGVKPSRVGQRLKKIRESKGLTLDRVAHKAGIAVPNLSRLEHDKHIPKLETLEKVAKALGVSLVEIVSETPVKAAVLA